ncbi:VCBS domain-containing protein [Sphingomonas sp. Leaf257]|uniref:VCBS domain-containing protein n=1 Tax=Sphingomonas sp. Leaf257 TaxID=1736309 RepID=UPI0006F3E0EE|nr:VCBS domain-containing protein [Sphingomonas sp. Leaf257]KQO55643.1 hypothetical protein ASF14_04635 [Sphingomonas sp. Leaf257]
MVHDNLYGYGLFAKDDYYRFSSTDVMSGNILNNDREGDNGEKALRFFGGSRVSLTDSGTTEVAGKYGTFRIKADGSFTYALNESVKAATAGGTVLTENIPYKISDKMGKTDFAYLTMDINVGKTSQVRETVYTFDKNPTLDILSFGTTYDGDQMMFGSENGNQHWQADPWGLGFFSSTGTDFVLTDMTVATGNSSPVTAVVVFQGYRDGRLVGTKTVNLDATTISDQQHVSLAEMGKIDRVSYYIPNVVGGEFDGLPTLLFDDIHLLI